MNAESTPIKHKAKSCWGWAITPATIIPVSITNTEIELFNFLKYLHKIKAFMLKLYT